MHLNMTKEVTALRKMTVQQLKAKYAEVFGDETRTRVVKKLNRPQSSLTISRSQQKSTAISAES